MAKLELSPYFDEMYTKGDFPKFKILVDGKWTATKKTQDLISSTDGKKLAEIGVADAGDINRAIESAEKSTSKIRSMAAIDRIELMLKAMEELETHKDEIARALVAESGKALSSARGEINAAIERMRLSMEDSKKIVGEYLPGDWASDTSEKIALVIREPIGVVLGVSPFNYPVYTSIAKMLPALLAGNTVILKPPSADPIAFMMCVEIFRKVGLPTGTLQVITGSGSETGDLLTSSNKINMVSFTGSTAVGKHIASIAGLKKVHMELGGKGNALVLDDADLELAAKQCVKGSLELAGQRCDAISRILVVEGVYDKFVTKLKEHMSDFKFGNPLESDAITMGPVISEKAADRIDGMVKDAVTKGAKLLAGGKHNAAYYEPTLLVDVPLSAEIANEETFGPVVTVIKVKDTDDALKVANDSKYGLDSCVFTENFYNAWEAMKALQSGNVTLNAAPSHGTAYFPFGGVKESGYGKEGVGYTIDEMTVRKTLIFDLSPKHLGKSYMGTFKD
jgi:glyceraldehyde-3-phosphate dehydrogenase [NAD(P)+]